MARDLLADSGSIFVQIGDENVHTIRAVLDEIFGERNFIGNIVCLKTSGQASRYLSGVFDYVLMYGKNTSNTKYRSLYRKKKLGEAGTTQYVWFRDSEGVDQRISSQESVPDPSLVFAADNLTGQGVARDPTPYEYNGITYYPSSSGHWKPSYPTGLDRLARSERLKPIGRSLMYVRYLRDFNASPINNIWNDVLATGLTEQKLYVVQTSQRIAERCILMATDPGDLVLDPTCGSGTTAYVAEKWGRRWITIDTSRVALALARARIMAARYPFYLLADSREGQAKEAEISQRAPSEMPAYGNLRQGFVYERVPHITLKSIANNAEIDVIWETAQEELEPLRQELNDTLETTWEEWEIPREADEAWPGNAKATHQQWWERRITRQKEIDASIAARADFEYLYDKPIEDKNKVRVAGPFTVESITPHRVLGVDENGDVIDTIGEPKNGYGTGYDFGQIILENLKRSGVQQAHKEDRITFTSLTPWPGRLVCAEGRYVEGGEGNEDDPAADGMVKKAGIFIGPEFGTVSRPDLVEAAREAAECGFDVLIACAFNYDAHTTEFESLGRIPVLKARMNADLHMAGELKNTGNGNLFVIFGEPDIDVLGTEDGQLQVRVNGVDVFHPNTGEVRSDGPDGIACWFVDTDYNQESFFVRHAYFLGANDPYKSLKTTLKAEIDPDAWATLNSDTSRPFPKPDSGRIAVKVINHLGDEVMKVFRVGSNNHSLA